VPFQECADLCGGRRDCTAFDTSDPRGNKVRCWLFKHKDVVPASAVPGHCFSVVGVTEKHKKKIAAAKQKAADAKNKKKRPVVHRPKLSHKLLGEGMCRGEKWAGAHWPKDVGRRTLEGCFRACQKSHGCTAFDLVPKPGGGGKKAKAASDVAKKACLLYGHSDVRPAWALPGECHIMADPEEEDDEVEPQDLEGSVSVKLIGEGACRGLDWANGKWPVVKGFQTIEDCGKLCLGTKRCTAFHVGTASKLSKGKFQCYLFGHKGVKPASQVPGACFRAVGKVKLTKKAAEAKKRREELAAKATGHGPDTDGGGGKDKKREKRRYILRP
jgi:hypothetical protein